MKTKLFTVLLCLIVMACSKPKKYKVDFIKDEVSVHTQLVEYGQLIAKPETVVYNDSVTYDWYSDNNPYNNQWDFDVDVVTQDTTLYALKEKENNAEIIYEDSITIIGKWKLVKIQTSGFNPTGTVEVFDYSNYNIIYEFKLDNILTISGNIKDIDEYKGHKLGEYLYSFSVNDRIITEFTIEEFGSFQFSISSKQLEIGNKYLDGDTYYFIKQ